MTDEQIEAGARALDTYLPSEDLGGYFGYDWDGAESYRDTLRTAFRKAVEAAGLE